MGLRVMTIVRKRWVQIGLVGGLASYSYYKVNKSRKEEELAALAEAKNASVFKFFGFGGKKEEEQKKVEEDSSFFDLFQVYKDKQGNTDEVDRGKNVTSSSLFKSFSVDSVTIEEKIQEDEEEGSLFSGISHMLSAKKPSISNEPEKDTSPASSLAKSFGSLITGEISHQDFTNMIQTAQNYQKQGDVQETKSTLELLQLLKSKQAEVQSHISNSLGQSLPLELIQGFDPASIIYYLEKQDETKNPSWKRRKHRFRKGVDTDVVRDLNQALHLANISYLDSVEQVKSQLGVWTKNEWELVYAQMESLPEQPSHFLAIKKGQSRWSSQLEVLMVVRGTKTVPDMLTDALLDDEDYRDGKAHAGILRSGKYLVEKHEGLLEHLRELAKKKKIKLTLIGHSLGAGAASIAGMEFREKDNIEVQVIGFGCPAILSQELSESTKEYITTVIGDDDVVPRLNAETIANLHLDLMDYDWTSYAYRDIEDALMEVQKNLGFFGIDKKDVKSLLRIVDKAMNKYVKPNTRKNQKLIRGKRLEPILFPPGNCIHFYRDGVSISGSYVPCTFFNEIDVKRTMVNDHLISLGYRKIFLELMRNYMQDDHFSFEDIEEN